MKRRKNGRGHQQEKLFQGGHESPPDKQRPEMLPESRGEGTDDLHLSGTGPDGPEGDLLLDNNEHRARPIRQATRRAGGSYRNARKSSAKEICRLDFNVDKKPTKPIEWGEVIVDTYAYNDPKWLAGKRLKVNMELANIIAINPHLSLDEANMVMILDGGRDSSSVVQNTNGGGRFHDFVVSRRINVTWKRIK